MEVGGSCCCHGDSHQPVIKVPETGSQGEEEGLGRNATSQGIGKGLWGEAQSGDVCCGPTGCQTTYLSPGQVSLQSRRSHPFPSGGHPSPPVQSVPQGPTTSETGGRRTEEGSPVKTLPELGLEEGEAFP